MSYFEQDKAWFLSSLANQKLVEKIKNITLIISDIDGCLTDGKVSYSAQDGIAKNFSIQDGFMMGKCNKEGMPHLALVSGRSDQAAEKRAKILGIPDELYHQGIDHNKSKSVQEIQNRLSVKPEQTLLFGDDLLDLETKPCISLFAAPRNAIFYVHANADLTPPRAGGDGALRLILDLLLYVQNKHIAQKTLENVLKG